MIEKQELIKELSKLFPQNNDARRIVDFATIPSGNIDFSGSPNSIWYSIITEAEKHKDGVNLIINSAKGDYPDNPVLNKLFTVKEDVMDEISKPFTFDKASLRNLIAENKMRDALSKLEIIGEYLHPSFRTDIIHFKAQLNAAEQDKKKGIIRTDDYNISIAKLREAIINQIDSIEKEAFAKVSKNTHE